MDQFIDLCILLGCDYCEKIRGVGPKSALKLIQEKKCIEDIIKSLDKKHSVPEEFHYEEARRLFKVNILQLTFSLLRQCFRFLLLPFYFNGLGS
jgi:flap endonuclease-1